MKKRVYWIVELNKGDTVYDILKGPYFSKEDAEADLRIEFKDNEDAEVIEMTEIKPND